MNDEQRDTMLIDIHGAIKGMEATVRDHTEEIKTIRIKVDDMAGNRTQIKLLWGMAVACFGGAVAGWFKK